MLWHGDARPAGRRRDRRPRRLLLRRLPALRRDRTVLAGDGVGRRVRPRRRARARHLQRLSDPLRGGAAARGAAAQRRPAFHLPPAASSRSQRTDTPFTRACDVGELLSIPVKHTTGRYHAPPEQLPRSKPRPGRAALRSGESPNGSPGRHRRRLQRAAQRRRSDAASRARGAAAARFRGRLEAVRLRRRWRDGRRCLSRDPSRTRSRRRAGRRARPHARRVRARLRQARPRAERGRARDVQPAVERALRATSTPRSCCARCRPKASGWSWGLARTPAPSTSATAGSSLSRSSRTTIPARSSRSRARPPASAGSCATSSRSARARSRCSTRCASASRRRSARATCSITPSPASATTATASASPTIGGEVYFEAPYETNCLVNAMALGLARREDMIRSAAAGLGNAVILFGATTGRDGIGGASVLASAELGEGEESKRPTVQVGDPFAENKLIECSLELLERGLARLAAGPRRRRADVERVGDGERRRRRHRPRRRPRAAARGRHGAVRDHGLGVAGADALRRRARRASTRCSRSARSGRSPAP